MSGQRIVKLEGDIYTCLAGNTVLEYHKDEITLDKRVYKLITYDQRQEAYKKIAKITTELSEIYTENISIEDSM